MEINIEQSSSEQLEQKEQQKELAQLNEEEKATENKQISPSSQAVEVKLGDLQQWWHEAQTPERSDRHTAKIDQILDSAYEKAKAEDLTASVEIGGRDFKAMQRDHYEFEQLHQNQSENIQIEASARGIRMR